MTYPYYTAAVPQPLPVPLESPYDRRIRPEHYLPDENLQEAVNLAILLGQPLLLTGEAGTGKTQLAYHLAHQLQLGEPLKFETKSNSAARDLFYVYEYLRHFQAAQTNQGSGDPRNYVHYHALGLAILRTLPRAEIDAFVTADFPDTAPCRSVVLIDEIDKAPRDFPNDLLNEVEGLYFRIPELGNLKVTADPALRPLLVFTSNTERHLPAAFLRRCVYYHLSFPNDTRLTQIIDKQLPDLAGSGDFVQAAIQLFNELRSQQLQKNPATAELLNWLIALRQLFPQAANPLAEPNSLMRTLPVLIKNKEDRELVNDWLATRK